MSSEHMYLCVSRVHQTTLFDSEKGYAPLAHYQELKIPQGVFLEFSPPNAQCEVDSHECMGSTGNIKND